MKLLLSEVNGGRYTLFAICNFFLCVNFQMPNHPLLQLKLPLFYCFVNKLMSSPTKSKIHRGSFNNYFMAKAQRGTA